MIGFTLVKGLTNVSIVKNPSEQLPSLVYTTRSLQVKGLSDVPNVTGVSFGRPISPFMNEIIAERSPTNATIVKEASGLNPNKQNTRRITASSSLLNVQSVTSHLNQKTTLKPTQKLTSSRSVSIVRHVHCPLAHQPSSRLTTTLTLGKGFTSVLSVINLLLSSPNSFSTG